MIEYIILNKNDKSFKPVLFSNGDLIIYGNLQEAKDDLKENEIISTLIIPNN